MAVALKMSGTYTPTLKEDPSEAEVISHRLLLRAGMIRKVAAGIYTFLPLAWRSIRKIEQIVREEMEAIGSQELMLPIVQPAELWHESGRWDLYGPELARLQDRSGRDFCLGPTHEEIITDLVRDEVRSYRDLPLSLFQINMKFRDEARPRFGLLRGREFIMKDAYSFHASQESLQEHYEAQARAYGNICDRLGLAWRPVEADSGQIGGKVTTEFMALAESGEAALVYCDCGWAANEEAAGTVVPRTPGVTEPRPLEKVHTPEIRTIAELAEFLGIPGHDTVKTMAGKTAEGRLVYFCVPGDRELNPIKADWAVPGVELLDEEDFKTLGIPKGSLGPVAPPAGTLVVADASLKDEVAWGVGANENDYHLLGAMPGRDFEVELWADLVLAQPGDGCPECGGVLKGARGIEVSQVFQLGTRYSESMGATFTAEDGTEQPFLMGCYGVGITRSLAAVIEQYNDENGIAWPVSVAPLEVAVVPLSVGDDVVYPVAEQIWRELAAAGVEVILDDRDERAGVKFNDADLIGWPYQVVVGKKGVAAGIVEVKTRATGERAEVPIADAVAMVAEMVLAAKA
ncbi:MAG: proline--tRNA ligase [Actinobacteria bacterium HGW-Actinobacteria-1]|jgi:prolyl-tRNA synthetase|nr:MAG: proline--tRNA ligase [Actinobacteria bacterium HGW-Actinobacteria-1]